MLERKSLLLPYENGKPYSEKPILYYWAVAATTPFTGGDVSPFGTRVPSALAAAVLVFGAAALAGRRGGEKEALIAGAATAVAPIVFWQGQYVQVDAALFRLPDAQLAGCFFLRRRRGEGFGAPLAVGAAGSARGGGPHQRAPRRGARGSGRPRPLRDRQVPAPPPPSATLSKHLCLSSPRPSLVFLRRARRRARLRLRPDRQPELEPLLPGLRPHPAVVVLLREHVERLLPVDGARARRAARPRAARAVSRAAGARVLRHRRRGLLRLPVDVAGQAGQVPARRIPVRGGPRCRARRGG